MVRGGVERACGRVGEPAVADAPRRARVVGRVAGEGGAERGLPQGLPELGDDLRGGVAQPVEDAQQSGADVLVEGARAPDGRGVAA